MALALRRAPPHTVEAGKMATVTGEIVIEAQAEAVQPRASVTVTQYTPPVLTVMLGVVAPLLQL